MVKPAAGTIAVWAAALAVFAVVCPVVGVDGRDWAAAVFAVAGVACAVVALAGRAPAIAGLALWVVALAAVRPSPAALSTVIAVVGFLAIFALAAAHGAATLLRVIVALNLAVMAAQAAGVWEPLLRTVAPAARFTVNNSLHPLVGLTSSTGDLACVLAMAIPFCFSGRWVFLGGAAFFALCSTSALSGIVAGIAGLAVAAYPAARRHASPAVLLAGGGLFVSTFLSAGWHEIGAAWADERWSVWKSAADLWIAGAPIAGHGVGSWAAGLFSVVEGDQVRVWDRLHFDALQFGYETGAVGVVLAGLAWVFAIAAARSRGNLAAAGAVVAAGVCQFGHFPFHVAPAAIVAALVLGEAYRGDARC